MAKKKKVRKIAAVAKPANPFTKPHKKTKTA